jgi:hypothetical protein
MSELPASQYLQVWRARLSMAERGVTSPPPHVVATMRRLVEAFSAMDPKAEVRVEIHEGRTRFIAVATGELLAEYSFTDDAP